MTVEVLVFSVLRDHLGREAFEVVLPEGATGQTLLAQLAGEHPALDAYRGSIRLAVNEAYVASEVDLADGDTVALITPVSGG